MLINSEVRVANTLRCRRVACLVCAFLSAFLALEAVGTQHARRINSWLVNGPHASKGPSALETEFVGNERDLRPSIGDSNWHFMDDRLYCRNQDDYVDLFTFFMPDRSGAPRGGSDQPMRRQ